jgi:hypothetical protein
MSDYAHEDPTGPASVAETANPDDGPEGGYGVPAGADTNWVDPDADANTDLMRPDSDPLPDAQVPGISPDGQAPTR